MIKKAIAALVIIGLIVLYIVYRPSDSSDAVTGDATSNAKTSSTTEPVSTAPKGQYKDGTYTGNLADAIFGPMQVKITVKNGRLVDVMYLKYPNDPGYTTELNQKIMPVMAQESITIQSAEVDMISGATQTVDGFRETLRNALAQAKA
jgi:uncharacterized protein with FMN-binding domain